MQENEQLSERELEILRLVATGAANKEIARVLVISPNTVKVHLRNIFAKIGVSTRTEATLYAIQIGLINPGSAATTEPEAPDTAGPREMPELENGLADGMKNDAVGAVRVQQPANTTIPQIAAPAVVETTRRARTIQPWQIGLLVLALLLLISSGVMGARMLLAPTPLPTRTSAAAQTGIEIQRWSELKQLPSARKGMGVVEYENRIYLVGGEITQGIDGALFSYWPEQNTWETLTDKPTPVSDVQAALLGEKIYVPGGRTAGGEATDRLEVYDPRANRWEEKAPLPVPISGYALAAFEGRLYLFGGQSGTKILATVYEYNPFENEWQERTPMSEPRAYASAVAASGHIHVMGGTNGKEVLALHQSYFPARDASDETAWEDLTPLPEGRYAMGAAHLAGTIFVVGGYNRPDRTTVGEVEPLQYLLQLNQWTAFDRPIRPVGSSPALLAFGNFLYALGGETSQGISNSNLSYQAIYTISVPILLDEGN